MNKREYLDDLEKRGASAAYYCPHGVSGNFEFIAVRMDDDMMRCPKCGKEYPYDYRKTSVGGHSG